MTSTQTATQEQVAELLEGKWRERILLPCPDDRASEIQMINDKWVCVCTWQQEELCEIMDSKIHKVGDTLKFKEEFKAEVFPPLARSINPDYWVLYRDMYEKLIKAPNKPFCGTSGRWKPAESMPEEFIRLIFTIKSVEVVQVDGVWYFEYGLERVEDGL